MAKPIPDGALYEHKRHRYPVTVCGEWLDGTVYFRKPGERTMSHMQREDFDQRFKPQCVQL